MVPVILLFIMVGKTTLTYFRTRSPSRRLSDIHPPPA
nr:MAG TPA: hypothetical protein [Microviridae sp.]